MGLTQSTLRSSKKAKPKMVPSGATITTDLLVSPEQVNAHAHPTLEQWIKESPTHPLSFTRAENEPHCYSAADNSQTDTTTTYHHHHGSEKTCDLENLETFDIDWSLSSSMDAAAVKYRDTFSTMETTRIKIDGRTREDDDIILVRSLPSSSTDKQEPRATTGMANYHNKKVVTFRSPRESDIIVFHSQYTKKR